MRMLTQAHVIQPSTYGDTRVVGSLVMYLQLLRPQGVNFAPAKLTPGLRAISSNLPGYR